MAGAPTDWQLGCTEMKQRGGHLLQSGQWSDCTFLVGTEPSQVMVSGHKLILAMASPVFEAMFYGGMAERNDPIPILDVQPEAFKALLEYIYTDNINISSFDKACELCYGAKKYMLPHLVKECTRYLWSDLYPRNACRAYEFARLFEENVLMEKCIQIISTNTKEVLNDSSFEEVELNTVITVFSLDHLNIDSELDLFEAAVRYAKAHEKRGTDRSSSPPATDNGVPSETKSKSPLPSTSNENEVNVDGSVESSPESTSEPCKASESEPCKAPEPEQTTPGPSSDDSKTNKEQKERVTIRSAIEKIRFLTLTATQFAGGPARSALLSQAESFAVLMNILSSQAPVPMPHGFSTCRVPRKQLIGGGPSTGMPTFTVDTPSPVTVEPVFGGELARPGNPLPHACLFSHARLNRHDAGGRAPMMAGVGMGVGVGVGVGVGMGMGSLALEQGERHSDFNKIYCQRPIIQHTDCFNASVLDCSVTFMVDKNICLLGVQVPTQAPCENSSSMSVGGGTGMLSGTASCCTRTCWTRTGRASRTRTTPAGCRTDTCSISCSTAPSTYSGTRYTRWASCSTKRVGIRWACALRKWRPSLYSSTLASARAATACATDSYDPSYSRTKYYRYENSFHLLCVPSHSLFDKLTT